MTVALLHYCVEHSSLQLASLSISTPAMRTEVPKAITCNHSFMKVHGGNVANDSFRISRTFLVIYAAHALGSVHADIFEETTTVHGSDQLSSGLSHDTISFITLTRKDMHDSFCNELHSCFFSLRILALRGEDLGSLAQR